MHDEAFYSRVQKGDDGCWLWQGARVNSGYGKVKRAGRFWLAHRWSFRLANGEPRPGTLVLHRCDVKACVNPAHLYAGDQAQNAKDEVERGTRKQGRKLTAEQAADVRRLYAAGGVSQWTLARRFGVTQVAISRIVRGQTYAD